MGIRAKIGLPLAVIIILLGLASWWLVNGQLLRLTEKSLGQTMLAKAQEVEGSIKASASMALQMAAMTSRLPEVMEAYKIAQTGPMADEKSPESQKAREMLRAALAPVLKGYEAATGQKLQLHYHLPNGRSLVRLWREKQIKRGDAWVDVSDDISGFRPTVLDVNANKKPVQGIELGRGGFAIRGVAPVAAADGAHLGSVEVLAEFDQVFKKAASGSGEAVQLFMNADKLAITEALQDAKKFPRVGDGFVRVSSEGALAENATLDMAQLEQGKRGLALRVDEHIATAAFPVKDYKGEQIGVMVYLLDVTDQQAIIGETGRLLLAVLAALLVVPIVFTLFIVSRLVLSPVRAIRGKIQEIAEGKADLKARLNLRQQDEVGALAMWFDRLMAKIEEMLCEVEGYHNLINSVPDPIFAVDDDFNILIANKATEKLLGCDLKELRKSRCADKFKTKFCGTSQCPIEQAKRVNGPFEAEIMNIGTEDRPHWIQPSGDILRDCYGNKVGYVEVAKNVSDLMHKEQEAQRTMDRLATVNAEIMDASGRIVDATQEMLERFGHMSDGAGVQRRRVEETATAMEEMNATVLEVAQNASRAAEEAGAAREQAERGAQVVAQSVEAIDAVRNQAQALKANMGELGKRAENIGQILNVISDIADQTNLLALNAAIEAARAGDAGRGFAVVADEVRKLAEKTMQATKEVGQAIHAIQDGARQNATVVDTAAQAVDKATTLAGESGQALRRIVDKVGQTTDQVQAIAAAAEEQSAASEEINRAIMEVSRITADTVSGLESSDGALQQLASLAARLDGLARR